ITPRLHQIAVLFLIIFSQEIATESSLGGPSFVTNGKIQHRINCPVTQSLSIYSTATPCKRTRNLHPT
ncbi:hypothetical protein SERLA73DRAFT_174418, partial [Serpula lacrymans var. lacrymans S7.3]